MEKKNKGPHKSTTVHLTTKDQERFRTLFQSSGEESVSGYIKKRLFGEPIKMFYRDRAYDEFIETAIRLKRALSSLADRLDDAHQSWLREEIQAIKELLMKIEEHVRKSKKRKKAD